MVRRILMRDINRRAYYNGCWYVMNRRYASVGPEVLVIRPGVGYTYLHPGTGRPEW